MKDANRQRRLLEYRPLDATREDRSMRFQEEMQKRWGAIAGRLGHVLGRDPQTLSMFSDQAYRHANEERFLIYQVDTALADRGIWNPVPRIGDIYAQLPRPELKKFASIRDPFARRNLPGERPSTFFDSKYYKKRLKQLRSHIEKIRPFDPNPDGLVVIGTPVNLDDFKVLPEVRHEVAVAEANEEVEVPQVQSLVKTTMLPKRLFFKTSPGSATSHSVTVSNEGTTAIYYKWETAHDIDLMTGDGSNRIPIQRSSLGSDIPDRFDWRASEAFTIQRSMQPHCRSEFCFTQISGSIRPSCRAVFDFAFKSDVPGCFTQRWIMRITPSAPSERPLSVSLRGCCEVEPPNLTSFKHSIDNSLHESERSRCIDEIIDSVFLRVADLIAIRRKTGDERIDGDVLVDDRAPAFEAANQQWGLVYSPGLYTSLHGVAHECWDALGVTGFDRFWDLNVESLTKMAMRIHDGDRKRAILREINEIIQRNMTASAAGNLTFSLAYVQLSTYLEELPNQFLADAAVLGVELPLFIVPKLPDPAELEAELESAARKHRGKRDKKPPPPPKKPIRKGKAEEEALRAPPVDLSGELSPELKASVRETIKDGLKKHLLSFENLATESRAVGQQLTRVNEIERLDTDLDAEIDDNLD
jgi:hypothetical protein